MAKKTAASTKSQSGRKSSRDGAKSKIRNTVLRSQLRNSRFDADRANAKNINIG